MLSLSRNNFSLGITGEQIALERNSPISQYGSFEQSNLEITSLGALKKRKGFKLLSNSQSVFDGVIEARLFNYSRNKILIISKRLVSSANEINYTTIDLNTNTFTNITDSTVLWSFKDLRIQSVQNGVILFDGIIKDLKLFIENTALSNYIDSASEYKPYYVKDAIKYQSRLILLCSEDTGDSLLAFSDMTNWQKYKTAGTGVEGFTLYFKKKNGEVLYNLSSNMNTLFVGSNIEFQAIISASDSDTILSSVNAKIITTSNFGLIDSNTVSISNYILYIAQDNRTIRKKILLNQGSAFFISEIDTSLNNYFELNVNATRIYHPINIESEKIYILCEPEIDEIKIIAITQGIDERGVTSFAANDELRFDLKANGISKIFDFYPMPDGRKVIIGNLGTNNKLVIAVQPVSMFSSALSDADQIPLDYLIEYNQVEYSLVYQANDNSINSAVDIFTVNDANDGCRITEVGQLNHYSVISYVNPKKVILNTKLSNSDRNLTCILKRNYIIETNDLNYFTGCEAQIIPDKVLSNNTVNVKIETENSALIIYLPDNIHISSYYLGFKYTSIYRTTYLLNPQYLIGYKLNISKVFLKIYSKNSDYMKIYTYLTDYYDTKVDPQSTVVECTYKKGLFKAEGINMLSDSNKMPLCLRFEIDTNFEYLINAIRIDVMFQNI